MRFQGIQAALRTFTTAVRSVPARRLRAAVSFPSFGRIPLPLSGATVLKAAPAIPLLSSFFGSRTAHAESNEEDKDKGKDNMSYPGKRSEEEWRAVLTPGM